jgi:hypothetical protein
MKTTKENTWKYLTESQRERIVDVVTDYLPSIMETCSPDQPAKLWLALREVGESIKRFRNLE